MVLYRYRAVTVSGEPVAGEREAADEAAVIRWLNEEGYLPIGAEPVTPGGRGSGRRSLLGTSVFTLELGKRLSQRELTLLTKDLARLVAARVPVERALQILMGVAETRRVAALLGRTLESLRSGGTLADALEAEGPPFTRAYVSVVRAGEASGSLDVVLRQLTEYLQRSREARASVVSALIYPTLLLAVSLLSIIVLMLFVVPQFETLFVSAGEALPLSTEIVVSVAEALRANGWALVLAATALVLLGVLLGRTAVVRRLWHRRVLKLPLFGALVRKMEVARFCRTLGTLVANGVPLLNALMIVRGTLTNTVLEAAAGSVVDALKAGRSMSEPLLEAGVFPPMACHMIRVGEEIGRLDVMLNDVADVYEQEVQHGLKSLLTLLEPAMILILGVIVGGIVLSILTGILSVNEIAF